MWSYCNHVAGDDLFLVDAYIYMYACIHTSAVPVQSTAKFDKPVLLPGSLCKILVILKSLKIWNISSPRVSGDWVFMNNNVAVESPYSGHYSYRPEPRLRGSCILSSWSLVLELTPEASHAWLRILWIQWITLWDACGGALPAYLGGPWQAALETRVMLMFLCDGSCLKTLDIHTTSDCDLPKVWLLTCH